MRDDWRKKQTYENTNVMNGMNGMNGIKNHSQENSRQTTSRRIPQHKDETTSSKSVSTPPLALDTNIGNYNLHDILKLFKIPTDFTEIDLKRAKRTTMRTHPDVSSLPAEYFQFFSSAYRMLEQIYECKNPQRRYERDVDIERLTNARKYETENNPEKELLMRDITKKEDFNRWFNDEFQKIDLADEESKGGYENWFRSKDGISEDMEKVPQNKMDAYFEKKKREAASRHALIRHEGVLEFNQSSLSSAGGGYELDRSGTSTQQYSYASGVFDKLQYDDLKRAHTETVIPISIQDELDRRPQFSSVEDYTTYRNRQNVMAMTKDEANSQLLRMATRNSELETQRAFNLIKQDEEARKMQDRWWSSIRTLKHHSAPM